MATDDVASMTNDLAAMTTGANIGNYLPDELLARILAPVDLKSLVQARGICKSWRASVESKELSDLRATMDTEPLIALIGGSDYYPGTSGNISTKISFRIGIDGPWFDGPPMPEPRYLHGAAAVGRKIYVVGGRPVAVRGTKGRIIGDYGADGQCTAGRIGPFDILVTDDEQHLEKWLGKWWTEIRDLPSHVRPSQKKEERYVMEVDRAPTADDLRALQEGVTTPLSGVDYEHSTCVVVGDQIMVFGGSNARHGGHNKGESLEDQLAYIRENNVGGRPRWDDLLLDHVRKAYEAEKYNLCWRIELDADGDIGEITFGRAGERISEQSENAAAVVVRL